MMLGGIGMVGGNLGAVGGVGAVSGGGASSNVGAAPAPAPIPSTVVSISAAGHTMAQTVNAPAPAGKTVEASNQLYGSNGQMQNTSGNQHQLDFLSVGGKHKDGGDPAIQAALIGGLMAG